jgi:phospholipase/lecithinase/hemolysin
LHDRLQDWNDQLDDRADDLGRRHNDTTIAVYDANAFLNTILDSPEKYGFKDATSMCTQQNCFWHDALHPMSAVHKLLTQDLVRFIATM